MDQLTVNGKVIITPRKLGNLAKDNPTYKIIRKVVMPKLRKLGVSELYIVPAPLPFAKTYKTYVHEYIQAVYSTGGVNTIAPYFAFVIYTNADGTALASDDIKVDFGYFEDNAFKNNVIKIFKDAFGGHYKWSGDIAKYMTIKYGSLNRSKSPVAKIQSSGISIFSNF